MSQPFAISQNPAVSKRMNKDNATNSGTKLASYQFGTPQQTGLGGLMGNSNLLADYIKLGTAMGRWTWRFSG